MPEIHILKTFKDKEGLVARGVGSGVKRCPDCGTASTSRKGGYIRRLQHLPVQGIRVRLELQMTRWRCRNDQCARQSFVERLDKSAPSHARLMHATGEAEQFYGSLVAPYRVGIESVGNSQWFVQLLEQLGHEVWVGDAAQIRASYVRKQKTDKRDASHILKLLVEDRFPRIWVPDAVSQELVIGGYTRGTHGFDAVLVGFYRGDQLYFCASVRAGFVPASRRALHAKLKPHETEACPFVNLPEASVGRWGQGLTAAKMKNCIWLHPEIVAQFRFLEWTPNDHLRHASFVGIRDDKAARSVVKEGASEAAKRKAPQRESVDSGRRQA